MGAPSPMDYVFSPASTDPCIVRSLIHRSLPEVEVTNQPLCVAVKLTTTLLVPTLPWPPGSLCLPTICHAMVKPLLEGLPLDGRMFMCSVLNNLVDFCGHWEAPGLFCGFCSCADPADMRRPEQTWRRLRVTVPPTRHGTNFPLPSAKGTRQGDEDRYDANPVVPVHMDDRQRALTASARAIVRLPSL